MICLETKPKSENNHPKRNMKTTTQTIRLNLSILVAGWIVLQSHPVVTLSATAATPLQVAQQAYLKASNTQGEKPTSSGDEFGWSVAVSGDTVVVGALFEDSNATGVNGNQTNNNAMRSGSAYVFVRNGTNWSQQAYLKASNTGAEDIFGSAVAAWEDTVVIGAPGEASNATGVNGNQSNNSATHSGAVYVFTRNGTNWTQQAYLKASNPETSDLFGTSVAMSGNTLVVGAFGEDSNATGVNGNQANNSASSSGAAYIFVRSGTTWTQQAYLKASNTGGPSPGDFVVDGDAFGFAVAVAVAGDTVVVGAIREDSNAIGENGGQGDNSALNSGAAYVFVRDGTNWSQQAYLKASNTGADDRFGVSVAVSGNTAAVGAYQEASNATGVNGNQSNNNAPYAGAAYVFVQSGTNWNQQAYLKASNTGGGQVGQFDGDFFGRAVAVSGDIVVVGAPNEDSNATGVNGNQNNNSPDGSGGNSGASYVFVRSGTNWTQHAYVKPSNSIWCYSFGFSMGLSGDTLVAGASGEFSDATGVNGNQNNANAIDSGAAYAFTGLRPDMRLVVTRNESALHLTATGTTNTNWRLESRDTVTGTNAWQPLTNITLGPSPTVIQQPLDSTNRFYRGAWLP